MKAFLDKALLVIGYNESSPFDYGDQIVAVAKEGEFLVPFHRDDMGVSSSLEITDKDGNVRQCLEEVMLKGTKSGEHNGMRKVRIEADDSLKVTTTCCIITATVVAVTGPCTISLKDISFEGPWTNFGYGHSCVTFGWVKYETTGLEHVTATAFVGTLKEYGDLRQQEEEARTAEENAWGGWDQKETARRRRGWAERLSDPAEEKAIQLAESLGY